MYCLADMAATSASEWVGGAAGAVMRGFFTAGGSAVSEMKWVVLRLPVSQSKARFSPFLPSFCAGIVSLAIIVRFRRDFQLKLNLASDRMLVLIS